MAIRHWHYHIPFRSALLRGTGHRSDEEASSTLRRAWIAGSLPYDLPAFPSGPGGCSGCVAQYSAEVGEIHSLALRK